MIRLKKSHLVSFSRESGNAARNAPSRGNGVVVGTFEEEEEGTGVASDVVKVEGEDPATPGPLP